VEWNSGDLEQSAELARGGLGGGRRRIDRIETYDMTSFRRVTYPLTLRVGAARRFTVCGVLAARPASRTSS